MCIVERTLNEVCSDFIPTSLNKADTGCWKVPDVCTKYLDASSRPALEHACEPQLRPSGWWPESRCN